MKWLGDEFIEIKYGKILLRLLLNRKNFYMYLFSIDLRESFVYLIYCYMVIVKENNCCMLGLIC